LTPQTQPFPAQKTGEHSKHNHSLLKEQVSTPNTTIPSLQNGKTLNTTTQLTERVNTPFITFSLSPQNGKHSKHNHSQLTEQLREQVNTPYTTIPTQTGIHSKHNHSLITEQVNTPNTTIPSSQNRLPNTTIPSSQNRVQESDEVDDDKQGSRAKGSLLPRPLAYSGMRVLTVKIEIIGFKKDATQYIEPYITVSVRDATGTELTAAQDTPVATKKESKCIVFNEEVHIQKSIESLPNGFSIFFEFKHFKPKKNMISTKCWAFMERDEVKEGPVALELYQKPADYKRKNIKLLTVKPLYLHLKIIFNT
ncbi:axin interactor, dorsalization-associated protein-like, partial [Saccostrea cucullata]|uniref:axin interactor, dorsalization-associated protein-like n=1 Tax=Saccostrea cuccullata TaxID=36930 RepID=UPI002ED2FB89